MTYRVPKGQRGAGKRFISKGAYLQWCNGEIEREKLPTDQVYTEIKWGNYIANKMLSKTKVQRKGPKRHERWS